MSKFGKPPVEYDAVSMGRILDRIEEVLRDQPTDTGTESTEERKVIAPILGSYAPSIGPTSSVSEIQFNAYNYWLPSGHWRVGDASQYINYDPAADTLTVGTAAADLLTLASTGATLDSDLIISTGKQIKTTAVGGRFAYLSGAGVYLEAPDIISTLQGDDFYLQYQTGVASARLLGSGTGGVDAKWVLSLSGDGLGGATLEPGVLKLSGTTSGVATITPPAVAGTPTLTLPTTTGTLALTSDIITTYLEYFSGTGAPSGATGDPGDVYIDIDVPRVHIKNYNDTSWLELVSTASGTQTISGAKTFSTGATFSATPNMTDGVWITEGTPTATAGRFSFYADAQDVPKGYVGTSSAVGVPITWEVNADATTAHVDGRTLATITLPTSHLVTGQVFDFEAYGKLADGGVNNTNSCTIKLLGNSTVLVTSSAFTLSLGGSGFWKARGRIYVVSDNGTTAQVRGMVWQQWDDGGALEESVQCQTTTTGLTMASANALTLQMDFSTTDADHALDTYCATIVQPY